MKKQTNCASGQFALGKSRSRATRGFLAGAVFFGIVSGNIDGARADEDGLSFWLPRNFGSLAAAPGGPGWFISSEDCRGLIKENQNEARNRIRHA